MVEIVYRYNPSGMAPLLRLALVSMTLACGGKVVPADGSMSGDGGSHADRALPPEVVGCNRLDGSTDPSGCGWLDCPGDGFACLPVGPAWRARTHDDT